MIEGRSVSPHTVQYNGDTPSQSDHCDLASPAFRDVGCPGSKPRWAPTMHHDGGGLAQGAAQVGVSRLRDATHDIAFARLVSGGRQADPWADTFG